MDEEFSDYIDKIRQEVLERRKYRRSANVVEAANQGEPHAIDLIKKLNKEPNVFWKYNLGLN